MNGPAIMRRRRISAPEDGAGGSGSLPQIMRDVTGYTFRPSQLIADCTVIVLVFKSTECPVCPVLLQRLSFLSGNRIWESDSQQEIHAQNFRDPFYGTMIILPVEGFQQAARLVLFTDATYIILCPGDQSKLIEIARSGGETWKNFPFIVDNPELMISASLLTGENMRLDRGEVMPSILEYDGTNHVVDFGRGPGRYGDIPLLQFLFRRRAQVEEDSQHTIFHANLLLSKTAAIDTRLSASPNRRNEFLPSEILEQIISYLPAEQIDMSWAKASITWYLATLAATRRHLRRAIRRTEELLCVSEGRTVVLDCNTGQYPAGTHIRWVPIKRVERQRREVMKWCNALYRVVGFKL